MHGIIDEKTDVFAFGVLLLEIITGRKPVDSSRQNLVLWVCETLDNVTFPTLYTDVGSFPNILKSFITTLVLKRVSYTYRQSP